MTAISCLLIGESCIGKTTYLTSIGQYIGSFKGFQFPLYKVAYQNVIYHIIESNWEKPPHGVDVIFWMFNESIKNQQEIFNHIRSNWPNLPLILLQKKNIPIPLLIRDKMTAVADINIDKMSPFLIHQSL